MNNIKQQYQQDPVTKHILEKGHKNFTVKDGAIYSNDNRLYVPHDKELTAELIRECHDTPLNGHLGEFKTLNRLSTHYYWPNMRKSVQQYIVKCQSCQKNKCTSQLPIGLLQALEVPGKRWETVTMDLITQLPKTKSGHDAI